LNKPHSSVKGLLTAGAAYNYEALLVFRAVVGFGVGSLTIPFDLLAEFLPSTHRGRFLMFIDFFWTLGSLYVTAMAWLFLESFGWRFLAYCVSFPVLVVSVAAVFLLPESPRWLLLKGRVKDSRFVLTDMASASNFELDFVDDPDAVAASPPHPPASTKTTAPPTESSPIVPDEAALPTGHGHQHHARYTDLWATPHMRGISFPLWIIWSSFGLSYYGLIFLIARLNTKPASVNSTVLCSFDYEAMLHNAVAELVGIGVAAVLIDRWGRTRTQAALYALGGVAVLAMALQWPTAAYVPYLSMVARMSAMAASCATWVATPELYATEVRATGHAVCSSLARVGAFFSPYIVFSNASVFTVGVLLATANFVAASVSLMLPETKGTVLAADKEGDSRNAPVFYARMSQRTPHKRVFLS